MAAFISVKNEISYHLFDCKNYEIIKKGKWHFLTLDSGATQLRSCNNKMNIEWVDGIDMDPEGKTIALLNRIGICMLVDINNDNPLTNLRLIQSEDMSNI